MKFRSGRRRIVAFVLVACIALFAVIAAGEWFKWRHVRSVVSDTINQIALSPEKPVVNKGFVWNTTYYVLANVEIKWDPVTDSGTQISTTPRHDALFVEMPGKVHTWAHSPNEALELIKQND